MTTVPSFNRIDLHAHSTASDGLYSPSELVRLAHEVHVEILGLVDHDTTDGLEEAIEAGERLGVAIVPGIEVNTELPGGRGDVHILGYYIEYGRPEFQENLRLLRGARERRGRRMVEKLRAAGFEITWERVRELAGDAVGRPHLARALIERGYADSVSDAFEKYLNPGQIGYVPRYKLSATDAIKLIKSARGVPVLAHPANIRDLEAEELPHLSMAGLQGLECYYGQYEPETVEWLLRLARAYGLLPTGGSDYHGPNMHPTPLGSRYMPEEAFERLERTGAFNHKLPVQRFTLPPMA